MKTNINPDLEQVFLARAKFTGDDDHAYTGSPAQLMAEVQQHVDIQVQAAKDEAAWRHKTFVLAIALGMAVAIIGEVLTW